MSIEARERWFATMMESGLAQQIFAPADVLRHATPEVLAKIQTLNAVAQARGQSLAQMALAWVLRDPRVTTALIGASKVTQLENNLAALENPSFAPAELAQIDAILGG